LVRLLAERPRKRMHQRSRLLDIFGDF